MLCGHFILFNTDINVNHGIAIQLIRNITSAIVWANKGAAGTFPVFYLGGGVQAPWTSLDTSLEAFWKLVYKTRNQTKWCTRMVASCWRVVHLGGRLWRCWAKMVVYYTRHTCISQRSYTLQVGCKFVMRKRDKAALLWQAKLLCFAIESRYRIDGRPGG